MPLTKINKHDVCICSGLLVTDNLKIEAIFSDKDFPLTLRYNGKVYGIFKTNAGKLRLGNIELEMNKFIKSRQGPCTTNK